MAITPESKMSQEVLSWRDTSLDSVRGTEAPKDPNKGYIALLGWSVNAIKAAQKFDRRYIVVAPDWAEDFCTANNIPYISWNFERLNDRSMEIAEKLKAEGVDVAIPLFEETVEWSGAINSILLNNPRMYGQSILFRDKALMKRRAQLGGIRVGIFEEAHEKEDVVRFMKRVNQTLLKLDGDPDDPIHVKAFDKAGCLGHRMIRTIEEVDSIPDEEYPLLMESHLDGWEFAVEAWIHDGKIKFLNISEYVTLGYSVFVPATKELESWRDAITKQVELLIKTFDIKFGQIHPEYFVTSDGTMYFGEVAYRPPGFKAFELIERAYGFSAYQASMLVFDPKSTQEEVDAFFPREVVDAKGYAGCFGVYPRRRVVSKLEMPKECIEHPYFESHELVPPVEETVPERNAFGTHWGLVFFFGDDPIKMRDLLKAQEELDFFV
ncbi:MAG: carboxylate--amine ligase [Piscirickettsiaceae bacterium CG_4_9_14_3_um_filter_43_564]|nr:carboxylate--amine ligase [Thiomicrospira sp.]OIP96428.1 MAG: carboxylate--amine ligase [Thiomicrospira sp. CG2_30_44_34]PIQ04287.1 MAG: carboxylate--amine ligase [Piscirickettsiaceae bacterium CG18_big_fil_WC_8_21_14_2_50_44_103]PIU39172.1 MAG: carboxylate--amine ligase [Piscirickettsiaceae bacterium CG07_land_8_20_14_0_80_44_28]PIW57686.1 MAG: carboxylate--amine ligase [Piscirickettsiaceae bacterium CG12_big_fil_rev_8_21_14_0_65_44_934]PIW77638.1 MAG: carboxylate--amine ligase [Pisciricke